MLQNLFKSVLLWPQQGFSDLAVNYLTLFLQQGPQESHTAPFSIFLNSVRMFYFVTVRQPRHYAVTAPIRMQRSLQP